MTAGSSTACPAATSVPGGGRRFLVDVEGRGALRRESVCLRREKRVSRARAADDSGWPELRSAVVRWHGSSATVVASCFLFVLVGPFYYECGRSLRRPHESASCK